MAHTFRVGQLVALAQTSGDRQNLRGRAADARDAVRRTAIPDQGPVERHRSGRPRGRDQAVLLKGPRQLCPQDEPESCEPNLAQPQEGGPIAAVSIGMAAVMIGSARPNRAGQPRSGMSSLRGPSCSLVDLTSGPIALSAATLASRRAFSCPGFTGTGRLGLALRFDRPSRPLRFVLLAKPCFHPGSGVLCPVRHASPLLIRAERPS